jgi:hypothetical protein
MRIVRELERSGIEPFRRNRGHGAFVHVLRGGARSDRSEVTETWSCGWIGVSGTTTNSLP